MSRPRIVCLIGSSRFREEFVREAYRLETTGHLVLCMAFFQHSDGLEVSEEQREVLEQVDRFRIDLADEVLVIDRPMPRCPNCKTWCLVKRIHVGTMVEHRCECYRGWPCWKAIPREYAPYVGPSTAKEIDYAVSRGKPVQFLSRLRPARQAAV